MHASTHTSQPSLNCHVNPGIADSAIGKISSAIGSASVKALDAAFTAGEAVVENAKNTTVGKVRHVNCN